VIFEGFARVTIATIRAMILVLAVIMLADYMIGHPVKAERSMASVALPLLLLVGREGIRWDK